MKFRAGLVPIVLALLVVCAPSFARTRPTRTVPSRARTVAATQVEALARALKDKKSSWAYSKLSTIAARKSSGILGMRAALALGYFDYTQGNYAQAQKWFSRTQGDALLGDYSLYWIGEASLALGQDADALARFKQLRRDYSDSVMTEQTLQSLATAALALHQPSEAVTALDAYPATRSKPSLLFLHAEANEQAAQTLQAAADYQAVYLRFPTSEQAREAGIKLSFLRESLGDKMPPISLDQRIAHAGMLFDSKDWNDARTEYSQLVPDVSGANRERAELRILECGVAQGADPSGMTALQLTDPDVTAERLLTLAQYYRSQHAEAQMAAAIEQMASRVPATKWMEQALFLGGNYFWVQLDRDAAAGYYKRLEENFPESLDAIPAQWRVAWTEVLKRQPDAAGLLTEHLRRFPGSPYTPDALYWLGRLAEEAKEPSLARSYYTKLTERYPENYFEGFAASRLRNLDPGPDDPVSVLATIPDLPPALKVGDTVPAAAAERQKRADALRSIGFDSSAELELRAAYAATGEPRLLLEAAQEAVKAGNCGAAIVTIRQIYPQLDAHPFASVPREVWLAAYALPFESSIRRWSAAQGLDPMLVAGLIHQESAFKPEARSNRDARGLMQLLPVTGRRLAKQSGVRYSQPRLFDPDYNIRLGTVYFANLRKQFGSVESALAAYDAGEDRVTAWTDGQQYREPAEFVDSIPFTETRDYVEIITRNTQIYKRLYGAGNESRNPPARHGR